MEILKKSQIIDFDSLDKEIFVNTLSRSQELAKLIDKGSRLLPNYYNFVFDLFLCFYKAEMLYNKKFEQGKGVNLFKTFIDDIYKNEFLKYIRNDTFLDETKSAVATVTFGNSVLEWLKTNNFFSKKSFSDLNKIENIEEEIKEINSELEVIKDIQEKNNDEDLAKKLDSIENEKNIDIHRLQDEMDDSLNNMNKKITDNKDQITNFINTGLMDMDARMSDYYSNSTLLEDNINSSANSEAGQKIDLAHKLIENDKLRKLANMMGSLKDIMHSVRNKNWRTRTDEIHSITLGNDIGKAISSEIIKLSNDALKKDFFLKYLDGQLQQYHLKDNRSKGPFIICLDCSSSMSGEKEIWSKGVALTLAETARKQKRKCDILAFTSGDYEVKHFDLSNSSIKSIDSEQFISVAEYFPGGGTSFEKPLTKALDLLKEYRENNADIVFITDGESHIGPGWLESFKEDKKNYEFKVYSILIDLVGNESQRTLEMFSDKITNVKNLTADNSKKIFVDI